MDVDYRFDFRVHRTGPFDLESGVSLPTKPDFSSILEEIIFFK